MYCTVNNRIKRYHYDKKKANIESFPLYDSEIMLSIKDEDRLIELTIK